MQTQKHPHSILLSEAIGLTSRYRQDIPVDMPLSETFSKDAVLQLLDVPGAAMLRIYYGRKENGAICAVLVAGTADGYDILPEASGNTADEEALILEDAIRCPEACPHASPLNTP